MVAASPKTLLIGFGNPGRLDDGLGPAVAAAFEVCGRPGLTVDADYQLTVEDAAAVAEHDVVIFADAAVKGAEPFSFEPVEPDPSCSFSTHSVSPASVLGLAHTLFNAKTRGYLLAVRGYEFDDFGEGLSSKARRNLAEAVSFLKQRIHRGLPEGGPDCGEERPAPAGAPFSEEPA